MCVKGLKMCVCHFSVVAGAHARPGSVFRSTARENMLRSSAAERDNSGTVHGKDSGNSRKEVLVTSVSSLVKHQTSSLDIQ